MKKLLRKRYLIPLAVLITVVLLFLLSLPSKTDRLISAIESNDIATVKSLLESGVDPNRTNVQPSKFWTFLEYAPRRPLSVACDQGNLQIVQLLIDYGATAEPIKGTDWSPLRETLFYYHPNDVQIVELLLQNGASADDVEDERPVFVAARMTPKVFDKEKTNGTVFLGGYDEASAEGITQIVVLLLGDEDVNAVNSYDQTLLILGVQKGNICLVEYLLSAGCDPSIVDIYGKTALDYANEVNNATIIDLLKQAQG